MENESTSIKTSQPLSNKKVWGFATGTLGEYFVYYLFYTYFLYFLTDYVLVPAAISGRSCQLPCFGMHSQIR